MPKMRTPKLHFHEDVFFSHFMPYRHPEATTFTWYDGLGLETYGDDLQLVQRLDARYVWTVVDDGENRDQWVCSGIHNVNRVCHLVTYRPHEWVAVDFLVRFRATFLTPVGLTRQLTQLKRHI